MRKVSDHVFAEFYLPGCNPGFLVTEEGLLMIDTPQQPMDALRWWERVREHGPVRHLVNTEPHLDHVVGNRYCKGVEVIAQAGFGVRYDEEIEYERTPHYLEWTERDDPDSVWLIDNPAYPPNPPTRTFVEGLELELGGHTINCVHLPGHSPEQVAVHLREERVLFTGDNIFHQTKTFVQEGDPWDWLAALDWIESAEVDVIVPGHGEPCDASYVPEQRQILQSWIDAVQSLFDRGLTEEEAKAVPLDIAAIDPYPLAQRLFDVVPQLDEMNVSNLYRRICARGTGRE